MDARVTVVADEVQVAAKPRRRTYTAEYAYVLVRLPDQSLFSILLGGSLVPGMVPIATGIAPFSFSSTLLSYTFSGTEPLGSYTFMSMLTQSGTLNTIGSADQDPFAVNP